MLKLLRYFFYIQYKFSLSNNVTDAGWATTMVTLFVGANSYILIDVLAMTTKINLLETSDAITILIGLTIFILMSFYLQRGDKPKQILQEFDKASKREKIWLNVCFVILQKL